MKKSFFWLIILFILLTTYSPNFNILKNLKPNIKKIIVENNSIIEIEEIEQKLFFFI